MVGSLDVRSLYPSLDQNESSRLVENLVMNSKVNFEGIDYRCAQTFIASNMSKKEIKKKKLQKILPSRRWKMGKRPGATTKELGQKKKKPTSSGPPAPSPTDPGPDPEADAEPEPADNDQSKWDHSNPPENLDEVQKRRLLATAVGIAVRTVFEHHTYSFGGIRYRQVLGGPIGLRLTSLVARIVMDSWAAGFLSKLDINGFKVWAFIKYVDDVNIVISMMDKDVEWVGDELLLVDRTGAEARPSVLGVAPSEEHTMGLVQQAADSIMPWLSFTHDLPSYHTNGMVPMLDVQVWIEHSPPGSGLPDSLAWKFYEKESSSSRVLKATSAYNWRSKIVTMSMEVMRRMQNSSRQIEISERGNILKTFARKLRSSGYSAKTSKSMIESGLRFYFRKVRIELEGGGKSKC